MQDSVFIDALDIAFTVDIESEPFDLTEVFQGTEFVLSALVDPPAGFEYSYQWTGPGTIASPTAQTTDVTAPLDVTGMVEYMVNVSIPEGCEESASIFIDVMEANFEIPNVFSPNNDSTNDTFGLFVGGGVEDFSCRVFNRWGQLIFESENVNDRWDGTYNNDPAPSDVYIYHMTFRIGGRDFSPTGDVTLVR